MPDVTPITKNAGGKAPAKPKADAKPKAAAKPKEKKVSTSTRTATIVSKEGTQKDAFTGETLPVTAFPTVRNSKTGKNDARGTVARKNLEAFRVANKAKREAAKAEKAAAAAKAKAEKATADAKAKAEKEAKAAAKAKADADAKAAAEAKAADEATG